MNLVKSVSSSDSELLTNFKALYLNGSNFELDPCFSKGSFYRGLEEPKYKFDLNPIREDVKQSDCKSLPLESNSIQSIIFDPPFMFGQHGQTKNNIMTQRFTMFNSYEDLKSTYVGFLQESYRLLTNKGYLFFKCQDYTDAKTTMTHCLVYNWAIESGFYAKDIYILTANGGRIYNPKLVQRHARKFHSYWWVFQK